MVFQKMLIHKRYLCKCHRYFSLHCVTLSTVNQDCIIQLIGGSTQCILCIFRYFCVIGGSHMQMYFMFIFDCQSIPTVLSLNDNLLWSVQRIGTKSWSHFHWLISTHYFLPLDREVCVVWSCLWSFVVHR